MPIKEIYTVNKIVLKDVVVFALVEKPCLLGIG